MMASAIVSTDASPRDRLSHHRLGGIWTTNDRMTGMTGLDLDERGNGGGEGGPTRSPSPDH